MQTAATVVISHYNAWEPDQLIALLDQVAAIPAGCPFGTRVVVNQAVPRPLELPERHRQIEVLYRPNVGYNIGAWDHGWRAGPPTPFYLFLQEECRIFRPGWLRAFVARARRPRVGIVGETVAYYNSTWEDIVEQEWGSTATRDYMARLEGWGVPLGPMATHLRSLVLCARREVLERTGGFRSGATKEEAIAVEVAITKQVEALGLRAEQVALRPFSFVAHPQWEEDRLQTLSWKWAARRLAGRYLGLARWQAYRRQRRRRRGEQVWAVEHAPPRQES